MNKWFQQQQEQNQVENVMSYLVAPTERSRMRFGRLLKYSKVPAKILKGLKVRCCTMHMLQASTRSSCRFDRFERANNFGLDPAGQISWIMCPLKLEARAFWA